MKIAALGLLFGFIGAAIADGEGFLPGLMFGVLVGFMLRDRARLARLESALAEVQSELARLQSAPRPPAAVAAAQPVSPPPEWVRAPLEPAHAPVLEVAPVRLDVAPQPSALREESPPAELSSQLPPLGESGAPGAAELSAENSSPFVAAREERAEEDLASPTAAEPTFAEKPASGAEAWLRDLLFGGNTIVRAGILVLLVGVVLLLRFAAEHAVFPIELRMAAAGLIALALIVVGYRQRLARPGFGRTLQGGGVAGLYLAVFFSFRTYHLLPAGLTFALLVCIAVSSGILAVVQDALALVVIGQLGGFMAPVLASSGGGSHVALFSYYLLLNLLVFGVAWYKPWRALNLIGFAFTFGVGSSWGALRYRPEDFASTEPFLIAFFLLYSLIPVLYALRRPDEPRGWVDASLVFGTPLAVLLLQYQLVKDVRFGMAFSTLALAAFYVLLSRVLYKRAPEALRRLIESFLAIGVGFATLAVPYAFDNHDFTGATWALEGAGLYWVGARQKRWISRLSGALLQLFAIAALLVQLDAHPPASAWPVANAHFLSSLLVCLGCLFVAFWSYRQRAELPDFESPGLQLLMLPGLGFFLLAAIDDVERHVPSSLHAGSAIAAVAASFLLLSRVAHRLQWPPGRFPAFGGAMVLPLVLLAWESSLSTHPLGRGGLIAFPLCFIALVDLVRTFVAEASWSQKPLHLALLWSATLFLALEVAHLVSDFAHMNVVWSGSAVACVVVLALFVTLGGVKRARWPFSEAAETYVTVGAGGLAFVLVLWTWWANIMLAGDVAPLPFVPLLHPLDLAQLLAFAAALRWYRALSQYTDDEGVRVAVPSVLGALAFFWFNALLARSVHHFAGVAFDPDALWRSTPLQVALSVSWSLLGLVGTALGSRRKLRWLWIVSASLLGIVVAKLFLIDLAQLSTIAKIGTFLVVGLLLVLVGYFAPVPPPAAAPSDVGVSR